MSYVLHLFAAADLSSVADATSMVLGSSGPQRPAHGAFERFRDALKVSWPNADSDPTLPEGLEPPGDGDAVWGLAVDSGRAGENLWRHVGQAATRAGLHVLDPQAGVLLRSDGVLVEMSGASRRLRAPMPWPVQAPRAIEVTTTSIRDVLLAAAAARFRGGGFVAVADDSGVWLERSAGSVAQRIRLSVGSASGNTGFSLHLGLQFGCAAVRDVWVNRFYEQVSEHVAVARRWGAPDFSVHADQLEETPGALSDEPGNRRFAFVGTHAEASAWFAKVARWFDETGRPLLDGRPRPQDWRRTSSIRSRCVGSRSTGISSSTSCSAGW